MNDELTVMTNAPCIIKHPESGKEYQVSFPDVRDIVMMTEKAKTLLFEETRKVSLAMQQSGASQDLIDETWKKYQSNDEAELNKLFVNPEMFKELVRICLLKNQPDISDQEIEAILTVDNLLIITRFFDKLKSVITVKENAEKN